MLFMPDCKQAFMLLSMKNADTPNEKLIFF